MSTSPPLVVIGLTLLLYLPACACPAVHVDEGGHACTAIRLGTVNGLGALVFGWVPPMTVPWSANPLVAAGAILLLCRRAKAAMCLGIVSVLMGLTTWGCYRFLDWKGLEVGYYLWQSSLIVFAVGAGVLWAMASRQPRVLQAILVDEVEREARRIGPVA